MALLDKMSKYNDYALDELGEELAKRNLPRSGAKADLIQRLSEDDWRHDVANTNNGDDGDVDMNRSAPSSVADPEESSSSSPRLSIQGETADTIIKRKLASCLLGVKYVGSFAAFKASQKNTDPGLHIDGVGQIRLPLAPNDAVAIMAAGTQAVFGRGSSTIMDKSFRNTKELSLDQFQLRNPAWSQEIIGILTTLTKELGIRENPSGVEAKLYKLLLYEEGAMFKAHKVFEKADSMFGTLIICLPSKHKGGHVELTHRGEQVIFQTEGASEYGQSHILWYSDVSHEVKPVAEGYRLVLAYNLIRTSGYDPGSADIVAQEKSNFQKILQEWTRHYNAGQMALKKLAYVLEHKYTKPNLHFDQLKGHDRLLSQFVRSLCEKEEFVPVIANINLTVQKNSDEDSDDASQKLTMTNIIEVSGHEMFPEATLTFEEIIQNDCFDRLADESDHEETGNEGMNSTYYYRNTVLMLMPGAYKLEFQLSHLDSPAVITWIREHVIHLDSDPDDVWRKHLVEICKSESDPNRIKDRYSCFRDMLIAEVIRAATAIRDAGLIQQACKGCCSLYQFNPEVCKAVTDASTVFLFHDLHLRRVNSLVFGFPIFFTEGTLASSLEELTRYHTKVRERMTTVNEICSHYESKRAVSVTTQEVPGLMSWAKEQTINILCNAEEIDYEDVPYLLKLLNSEGEDHSNRILDLLKKYSKRTIVMISFVAEMFDACDRQEISSIITIQIFNDLVGSIIAAPSLSIFHPKQKSQEPHWDPDQSTRECIADKEYVEKCKFAKKVAVFYQQCLSNGHDGNAASVLLWLESEADTANVCIFPSFIIPFLLALQETLDQHRLSINAAQQAACQKLILTFLNRCVGMEPGRPSEWYRDEPPPSFYIYYHCSGCTSCSTLKDFLNNPAQEIAYFDVEDDRWKHVEYCTNQPKAGYVNKWIMETNMVQVTKIDPKHTEWEERFEGVQSALKSLQSCRALLGDKYDELMEMRMVKQPPADVQPSARET